MADYTQAFRNLQISIEGFGADDLLLSQFSGSEEISQLFSYNLVLLSSSTYKGSAVLGKNATVKIVKADGSDRVFNGIITQFTSMGKYKENNDLYYYEAVFAPKLSYLNNNRNYRVFQDENSFQVIEDVLKQWNIDYDGSKVDNSKLYTYQHVTQYAESDFNFISRLLEKEGLFYYFKHEAPTGDSSTGKHTMMICDKNPTVSSASSDSDSGNDTETPVLAYAPGSESTDMYSWQMEEHVGFQDIGYNDYNYQEASDDYNVSQSTAQQTAVDSDSKKQMLYYQQIGNYRLTTPDSKMKECGTKLVGTFVNAQKSYQSRWTGMTKNYDLYSGQPFKLTGFPGEDTLEALAKVTLITVQTTPYIPGNMDLSSDEEFNFNCQVIAQDLNTAFAPLPIATKPCVESLMEAVIYVAEQSGSSGSYQPEVQVKEGKVQIKYNWNNNNNVCWAMVSNQWSGNNYGQFTLPRNGQRVIVSFIDGDPDYPMIVGSHYDSNNPCPIDQEEDRNNYATVMRTHSVDATGKSAGNVTQTKEASNEDFTLDVESLASNTKNYNEISFYDMNGGTSSKGEGQGWATEAADEINPLTHIGELAGCGADPIEQIQDNYENNNFEGINIYSNNQLLSQASQNYILQAGKNLVIEAGNSIILKVGKNFITMTEESIDIRNNFKVTEDQPIWKWNNTGHLTTFDSFMNLQMFQTEVGGARVFCKAFLESYIGTYWGSKVDCLLFNQETSATTVRSFAGADYQKIVETMVDLSTQVAGCIPGGFGAGASSVTGAVSAAVVLAGLLKDIAEAIKEDAKYFFTLEKSEITMLPDKMEFKAGEIELAADPVNLQGNALAGMQATLDAAQQAAENSIGESQMDTLASTSASIANLANVVMTQIQLTEQGINQRTLLMKQEVLDKINTTAAEVEEEVLKVVQTTAEKTLDLIELNKDCVKATLNLVESNYEALSESISKAEEQIEIANQTANIAMLNSDIALISAIVALHTEEG